MDQGEPAGFSLPPNAAARQFARRGAGFIPSRASQLLVHYHLQIDDAEMIIFTLPLSDLAAG
jgi:hypothetical protein